MGISHRVEFLYVVNLQVVVHGHGEDESFALFGHVLLMKMLLQMTLLSSLKSRQREL